MLTGLADGRRAAPGLRLRPGTAEPADARPEAHRSTEAGRPAATTAPGRPAAPATTQAAPGRPEADGGTRRCRQADRGRQTGPLPPGTPKQGGVLIVGATDEAASLDPHWQNALARQQRTQNIYSYLVQTDDLRIQPDLAEKWEISPGKTYTFTLRKGVKFHNGVS